MNNNLKKLLKHQLSSAKSLAWYGLASDPPTLAHRAVIDAVLGSGLFDDVVVFPAGKLPYKDFEASDWQRWDMMEIWKSASGFDDEVIMSKFDLLQDEAMTWYELWKELQQLAPKKQHWLVVGSDQYEAIPVSWYRGAELFDEASFVVVPREGYELDRVADHHKLLSVEPIPGSSTEVRRGDLSLVDEKVRAYIEQEGLYTDEIASSSSQ